MTDDPFITHRSLLSRLPTRYFPDFHASSCDLYNNPGPPTRFWQRLYLWAKLPHLRAQS